MMDIKEIKQIRKQLGLTQHELAKMANVSQSLIAKIESNLLDPTYTNAKNIFLALESANKKKELKASDLMNHKVICVGSKETIRNAIKLMKSNGFSQLPVIEDHKSIGQINENLILNAIIDNRGKFVEDIMENAPPVVSEDSSVQIIRELLRYFPMVLVSKKGQLRGVITKTDIISKSY